MSWLITGAAGYIGSHIFQELTNRNIEVIGLDSSEVNISTRFPPGKIIGGDIRDVELLRSIFDTQEIEGIIHCAALKSVSESILIPDEYLEINFLSTQNLVKICEEYGVRSFIFSSTAAVYSLDDSGLEMNEDHALGPQNPYGISKMEAELFINDFALTSNMKFLIFRYFNVAGTGDPNLGEPNGDNLIPKLCRKYLAGEEFEIFGTSHPTRDGTCIRDFLHIEDLVEAHLLGIENLTSENANNVAIINLGTNQGYSVLEVIAALEKIVGSTINYQPCPPRVGDLATVVASNEVALRTLGWHPKRTLEEMVKSSLQVVLKAVY
jgi:UDP-glucose 4-epimerase